MSLSCHFVSFQDGKIDVSFKITIRLKFMNDLSKI
jgi:hypothetical protein